MKLTLLGLALGAVVQSQCNISPVPTPTGVITVPVGYKPDGPPLLPTGAASQDDKVKRQDDPDDHGIFFSLPGPVIPTDMPTVYPRPTEKSSSTAEITHQEAIANTLSSLHITATAIATNVPTHQARAEDLSVISRRPHRPSFSVHIPIPITSDRPAVEERGEEFSVISRRPHFPTHRPTLSVHIPIPITSDRPAVEERGEEFSVISRRPHFPTHRPTLSVHIPIPIPSDQPQVVEGRAEAFSIPRPHLPTHRPTRTFHIPIPIPSDRPPVVEERAEAFSVISRRPHFTQTSSHWTGTVYPSGFPTVHPSTVERAEERVSVISRRPHFTTATAVPTTLMKIVV